MRLVFTEIAWEDYQWFQEKDRRLLKRLNALIKETLRAPFEGIGKPERLKGELAGRWPRRIDEEHRLVYAVENDQLVIFNCRYHYET
jgi:toxin YoeB